jgi:hypothetical protein
MFDADVVFAAWHSSAGKLRFRVIKGSALLRRAMSGEHLDLSVDALPCRSRVEAEQATQVFGDGTAVH